MCIVGTMKLLTLVVLVLISTAWPQEPTVTACRDKAVEWGMTMAPDAGPSKGLPHTKARLHTMSFMTLFEHHNFMLRCEEIDPDPHAVGVYRNLGFLMAAEQLERETLFLDRHGLFGMMLEEDNDPKNR